MMVLSSILALTLLFPENSICFFPLFIFKPLKNVVEMSDQLELLKWIIALVFLDITPRSFVVSVSLPYK